MLILLPIFFNIKILEFIVNINHASRRLNRLSVVIHILRKFKFPSRNLKVMLAAG